MDNCIKTKIVGVTYRNDDGSRRQDIISELMPSETLKLVDMATDEHPEAIGVFDLAGQQCGYLNKALAIDIRKLGKDFEEFYVQVLDITGGDGRSYGCNIRIIIDDDYFCQVIVEDNNTIKINTPLTDLDNDTEEAIASHAQSISTLSIQDELYLFAQDSSSPIRVMSLDGHCCGYLPAFACENIRKRPASLDEYTVSVIKTRTSPEHYCKVLVKPGLSAPARKRANAYAEAKRKADEEAAADLKKRATERLAAKKATQSTQDQNAVNPIPHKKQSVGCLSIIVISIAALTALILLL